MKENKVTLFLMGLKGLTTIEKIIDSNLSEYINAVVIARDKNIVKDYYHEIEQLCLTNNILSFDKKNLKNANFSRYSIAISWRWLIQLSDSQRLIVIHDSILPKYRGFAPLVNQLIHKESEIGITALYATEEYDKGEIIDQEKIAIQYPIKIQNAIELISPLYGKIVCSIINNIKNKTTIKSFPQNEFQATYSLWRNENDYWVDWQKDATQIKRFVDAVGFPYNGACTKLFNDKIILENVEIEQDVKIMNRDCGKIIFIKNNYPVVVCGTGLLKIKKAYYAKDKTSIFPLKKFRIKFQ